ncbi:MAG: hypothetical protein LWW86_12755 [Micrococcales bacterium]|nr:hypothetical protein [Micrococcales bacterium]
MSVRVPLYVGASILFPEGPRLVCELTQAGYVTRDVTGREEQVSWQDVQPAREILDGRVDAIAEPLASTFASLSLDGQQEALDRQEVVLTILTGYANGHAALARPGEPFTAFDPVNGLSNARKFAAMAQHLAHEADVDRRQRRALEEGRRAPGARLKAVSPRAIANWHRDYTQDINGGLLALIDGRRRRHYRTFDNLDAEIKRVADQVASRMDGTLSILSIDELYRRTRLALKAEGLHDLAVPEATLRGYLRHLGKVNGSTTGAQVSHKLRGVLALSAYPALRPGQVVAIDATRADTFCVDPWTGKVISVEILTAIDICTRVVLALRVVPRSASTVEAGLLLYDVLRPFSQVVEAGRADDWRWAGVPEAIGPIGEAVAHAEKLSGRPLIGEHAIPGLLPEAVRADKGSIFTSGHFRRICDSLDIHLLHSRGKKATDNAFVERWHETLQRCLQMLAGHKGRNVAQRGQDAGKVVYENGQAHFKGDGPGLTPRELEVRLREFISTDYHRTRHEGLTVVDRHINQSSTAAGFTPLEVFDALLAATGRLHVLQRPDLMYDLLPTMWLTIRHDGVEYKNLTFDCAALDEFRAVPQGFFRDQDRAALFFYDPRDLSNLWFRHPTTTEIHQVPWRRSFQLSSPMTEVVLDEARTLVRRRGGRNTPINRKTIQDEILAVINDIASIDRLRANPDLSDWARSLPAAHMRVSRSQFDHHEAAQAAARTTHGASPNPTGPPPAPSAAAPAAEAFDPSEYAWPPLDDEGQR